jgi:putative effector of murein hydrolase LrgA (UPF0299 family)
MPALTYPIEMAIKAARIMAGFLLSIGTIALLFVFIRLASMPPRPDTWKLQAALLVVALLLYFLPGTLMLFLAWKMGSAAKWPFIVAMVIGGLAILGVSAQTLESCATGDGPGMIGGGIVEVLVGGPALYFLVRCWNALPELRFVRSQAPPRRGIDPIIGGVVKPRVGPNSPIPPRKPTSMRLPPRPNLPGRY